MENKNNNELTVINEQEVLGKTFRIYGDFENPLFLAKDIANWIEHSDTSMMVKNIDDDEKVTSIVCTLGGNQSALFLTEDGMYEVLMQSRKPIAKQFKKQVKIILKSIRKHGTYMTEEVIEKTLTDPDFIIQLATQLKEERLKRILAENKIEEQKPLVGFAETCLKSKDNILVRQVSKIAQDEGIDIGEKKLYKKLREWGLILTSSTEPSQRGMNSLYFVVEEKSVDTPYGVKLSRITKVSPKGQVFIIEKLKKELL